MKRSDYAATIYKRELKALEERNRALHQELERSRLLVGVDLRDLAAAFPALRTLFVALHWVHMAADPLSSKEIDGQLVMSSGEPPDEGAATRSARARLRRVNGQVERLAERIEVEMSGERVRVEKPRCRSRRCPYPNRSQDVGAKFCAYCGRDMSAKVASDGN